MLFKSTDSVCLVTGCAREWLLLINSFIWNSFPLCTGRKIGDETRPACCCRQFCHLSPPLCFFCLPGVRTCQLGPEAWPALHRAWWLWVSWWEQFSYIGPTAGVAGADPCHILNSEGQKGVKNVPGVPHLGSTQAWQWSFAVKGPLPLPGGGGEYLKIIYTVEALGLF